MAELKQEHRLVRGWYSRDRWPYVLLPLTLLYWLLVIIRRYCYSIGVFSSWRAPVPVVVIGNITAGGTGKTPLTIHLVNALKARGFKPGIVSRGYGSRAPYYPFEVTARTPVREAGDEPLLIARRTACPVIITSDRIAAAKKLLAQHDCDIIVADDGLQHYPLQRDIEVLVIDSEREFGNGFCFPTGPLREPKGRINRVDCIVVNGNARSVYTAAVPQLSMTLKPTTLVNLQSNDTLSIDEQAIRQLSDHGAVHAVAGIGNPQRFFNTLKALGLEITEHVFADHHYYTSGDIAFDDQAAVVMTEKDAVKLQQFAKANHWFLAVEAELDTAFVNNILEKLKQLGHYEL